MIALEQLEKARLGSGRSLHAAKRQSPEPIVDVFDVEHQILHPERCSLADRRELRGLEVRVAEGRLIAPLLGEGCEGANDVEDPAAQDRRVRAASESRSALSVT